MSLVEAEVVLLMNDMCVHSFVVSRSCSKLRRFVIATLLEGMGYGSRMNIEGDKGHRNEKWRDRKNITAQGEKEEEEVEN